MSIRDSFADAVNSYIDVKFLHQGRTRSGIDCAGLIVCGLKDVGVAIDDDVSYRMFDSGALLNKHIDDLCDKLKVWQVVRGDIVKFKVDSNMVHVGVIVDVSDRIVITHASRNHGLVVSHGLTGNKSNLEFYRLRCLDE